MCKEFVLFSTLHEKLQFFGSGGILGEVRNGLRECVIRVILEMLALLYYLNLKKKLDKVTSHFNFNS